jgi:hypothetical protein
MTDQRIPLVQRSQTWVTTEYQSPFGHYEEFVKVLGTDGVVWDSLKHPRDRYGRFIRTFSHIKFNLNGTSGDTSKLSGDVMGVDPDKVKVKVTGVPEGAPPGGPQVGDEIFIHRNQVEVQEIVAQLHGLGHAGRLNGQEIDQVNRGIRQLQRMGLHDEAKELTSILQVAAAELNPRDPNSQIAKDGAIKRFRDLAEHLDELRGEGFPDGTNFDDVRDQMTPAQIKRVDQLGNVIDTTFTARHSLGDKTIPDANSSEGVVKAKMGETRISLAQGELQKSFDNNVKLWDDTGPSLTTTAQTKPVPIAVVDTARPDAQPNANIISSLIRSSYARYRSGLNRTAGYKQAQRVAPGARFHEDKNGDEVIVGSTVVLDANPTKGRPEAVTGQIMNIAWNKRDKKTRLVFREFDPEFKLGNTNSKGQPLPYKDREGVPSTTITLADDDQQNTMFTNLALQGKTAVIEQMSKALSEDTIANLQAIAGRRLAESGAKRTSPTGAVDMIPIQDRVKSDKFDEALRIGDQVLGPNGERGTVVYVEPNVKSNTTKVLYTNGQLSDRITSKSFIRLHGPSSEVFPGQPQFGDSNYIPTREEAAQIAEGHGAQSVADAIRNGGDASAIQDAMKTDQAFQDFTHEIAPAYDRRDQQGSTGKEVSAEDKALLGDGNVLAAASAGQFREPTPPRIPTPEEIAPPTAETEGERPENPANTEEKVTEEGVTVREEDGSTIVDGNTEDPIPTEDTQAVDEAIQQAEGTKKPEQPPEAELPQQIDQPPEQPPEQPAELRPALADKVLADVGKLVEEAKQGDHVDNSEISQLNEMMNRLTEAHRQKDGPALVRALQSMTGVVNRATNEGLHPSRLRQVLNRAAVQDGKPVPLHQLVQNRLDARDDIFSGKPMERVERAPETPNETPEAVDPQVDATDNALADALLADDQTSKTIDADGNPIEDGFFVADPKTVREFDTQPTQQDLLDFLGETEGSTFDDVSVWFNENDNTWRMARVSVHADEQEATEAARANESNQFVNIGDGSVNNIALDTDPNLPAESVEDPRSEERRVRAAGAGKTAARSTSKQKKMLDHVADSSGDAEVSRIAKSVKNGEEITGADASRLADAIDGMDASQFDKPSDKGVASQLAHRLARAAGEEGARGYSSDNTALRRTSDVSIALSGQSQDDQIRQLTMDARTDIKNGDMAAAAQKFRDAAARYDSLNLPSDTPATRAREHADRLDAMGGTTAPSTEAQVPLTGKDELAKAGVPEVTPITANTLSNPTTPRSREVSAEEFAALAVQGKEKLAPRWDNASEPMITSGEVLDELKNTAWDSVQTEWGGMTVDAHDAQAIDPSEGFSLTVKHPGMDTVSIPIQGSTQDDFNAAMDEAMRRFGGDENGPLWMEGAHLGIFRNEDTGNFEIDPTLMLDSVDDVEQIGAYANSVGGAFNYADGLGYWPPHIAEGAPGGGQAEGPAGAGEVARPGGQGGEAQPGVGPPDQGPESPAGVGPEAPQVGGTPADVVNGLFDDIGQPADYGTEYQGRQMIEARSNANAGLPHDAAKNLRNVAAQEPDGSENKQKMLDAADALDSMPEITDAAPGSDSTTPPGEPPPPNANTGPPTPDEINQILSNADSALESERQAEGENGPQGWNDTADELNGQLLDLMAKVKANPNDSSLATDLRALASEMDGNFRLTDAGPFVDELNALADRIDAGGTPGAGETSADAPFSVRTTPVPSGTW